jgi:cytochrome d ubiquinol oxidase subunit II
MGPVWEANHVWLIFVIVVLFTCFPSGFVKLATALFIPFHLALVGIMLRGAAFVFRGHDLERSSGGARRTIAWGAVFGVASVVSPVLLGAAFGAVTAGDLLNPLKAMPWLSVYGIACGLLALSTCAYLAAVYLVVETRGELREDFRRRAILAGTTTAALAFAVLALAYFEARWFFDRMFSPLALPVVLAGLVFFAGSAWAVFTHKYRLSRWFAAGEVVLLILGWGLAQQPYLAWPDLKITQVVGPPATIIFVLKALPVGAVVLVPSLWLLFKVFKGSKGSTAQA